MTRTISLAQQNYQFSENQPVEYKVEIKPSEESLEAYTDITDTVLKGKILRTIQGTPNKAQITVESEIGAFDITNVYSLLRSRFQEGAKVKISLGYSTADVLLFTGYVGEGYDHDYTVGDKEVVTIRLIDRGGKYSGIDYQEKTITTELYTNMTVKAILEAILVTYGGMTGAGVDIFVDADLATLTVDSVQFTNKSLWDIIQTCCFTKQQAGYFDENGYFRTKPLQYLSLDFSGTGYDGTNRESYQPYWNTDALLSGVTVIGGIKFPGDPSHSLKVIDVNPYNGEFGFIPEFETNTSGTGNPWYDCVYYHLGAAPVTQPWKGEMVGVGWQGTVVPVDGHGVVIPGGDGSKYDWDYGYPLDPWGRIALWWDTRGQADEGDGNNWYLICQGPFEYTVNGIPKEPHQDPKTGIGDDAYFGSYGYFTKYNAHDGTAVSIEPDSLSIDPNAPDGDGSYFPHWSIRNLIDAGILKTRIGLVPSQEDWAAGPGKFNVNSKSYPVVGGYDGPTETEYWVYCMTYLDYWSWYWNYKGNHLGDDDSYWLSYEDWFNELFRWGQAYIANSTDLSAEHYTGTAIDTELDNLYGTSRYETFENPLLFSDESCEELAAMIIDNRKKFHISVRVKQFADLSIEPGDYGQVYNNRNDCHQNILVVSTEYDFGSDESTPLRLTLTAGLISSEGQTIKAYRT